MHFKKLLMVKNLTSGLLLMIPVIGMVLLTGLGIDHHSAWAYQRVAINDGEYWRLFSAHFVHLNAWHLLFNTVAGIILYLVTCFVVSPIQWVSATLSCMVGVSVGLWLFSPEVIWYVGLSGVLHGLMVIIAWQYWSREPVLTSIGLLGLVAKLSGEQFRNIPNAVFWLDHPIIVDAHLYGACSGVIYSMGWAVFANVQRRLNNI